MILSSGLRLATVYMEKGKGKAISVIGREGLEGCETSRPPVKYFEDLFEIWAFLL
jgi:hypothetical protein